MVQKKAFSLTTAFSGATATVQQQEELKNLRSELDRIKTENTRLKEKHLSQLREELTKHSGEHLIDIDKLHPSIQARQTFSLSAIRRRAESLKRYGQKNPLIVVPRDDGHFDIEDGELRWRGAKLLVEEEGLFIWKQLKAVFAPPPEDKENLHQRSLIHHLHKEDLNALDRIDAIIKHITQQVELEISSEELLNSNDNLQLAQEQKIKKIIRNLDYRFKKSSSDRATLNQLIEESKQQQTLVIQTFELPALPEQILLILLELQINISSLAANDLPMLSLPSDLKESIRNLGLPCHHALAISKLSSTHLQVSESLAIQKRKELVEEVLEKSLSLKATRNIIKQILAGAGQGKSSAKNQILLTKLNSVLNELSLSGLEPKELTNLQKVLQSKMDELEKILTVT